MHMLMFSTRASGFHTGRTDKTQTRSSHSMRCGASGDSIPPSRYDRDGSITPESLVSPARLMQERAHCLIITLLFSFCFWVIRFRIQRLDSQFYTGPFHPVGSELVVIVKKIRNQECEWHNKNTRFWGRKCSALSCLR